MDWKKLAFALLVAAALAPLPALVAGCAAPAPPPPQPQPFPPRTHPRIPSQSVVPSLPSPSQPSSPATF